MNALTCGLITNTFVESFFMGTMAMYLYENLAGVSSPGEYLIQNMIHSTWTTVIFGQLWFIIPAYCLNFEPAQLDPMRLGVSIFFLVMNS